MGDKPHRTDDHGGNDLSAHEEKPVEFEQILITDELARRPHRGPDFRQERDALLALAGTLTVNPKAVLQAAAELAIELCRADLAGIGVLESGSGGAVLRWVAVAGTFAQNPGVLMPVEFGPCGQVIERDEVLLLREPERYFPALKGVEPRIYENLLAPWRTDRGVVGILWAVAHTPERRFDAEDARLLRSLATFAGAAHRVLTALEAEDGHAMVKARVQDRTRELEASNERLRNEAAERAGAERRFIEFSEASSDVLWMRDARTLHWDFLSPAFESVYGLSREEALKGDDMHNWLELVENVDRDLVQSHIGRVLSGESVTFEYRIRRQTDGQLRWIRSTDFPMHNEAGEVHRVGGIGQDVTDTKQAIEHQAMLLAELQHRVRNILATIHSIVRRSEQTSESVSEFAAHLNGRLDALARTQGLLTRSPGAGVDLENLIRDELNAQVASEEKYTLEGPELRLAPKAAEVLTLAVHELTTNATKYGALARQSGTIRAAWSLFDNDGAPWLRFEWTEEGVRNLAVAPRRSGFGTELIERRVPYELNGRGSLFFEPGGIRCTIEFPMVEGRSILQTDARWVADWIAHD